MEQDKIKLDEGSDLSFLKGSSAKNEHLQTMLEELKAQHSMNKNFDTDLEAVKEHFKKNFIIDKDGKFNEFRMLKKGNVSKLQKWSKQRPDTILEIADDGKTRQYKRTNVYGDASNVVQKTKIDYETAEDDRVLGIPYAQAQAGDRVYIINGKVFTGWSLYFSLSSIKSPEDYARNVDLVYNVPYLFSSILLKAQLGLGCGYLLNYGAESLEVPEELLAARYLKRLKINTKKLVKTGFHLHTYGNAYWALRRDKDGVADKVTILQPERLKIFLDPMTTKILFYIYLPPIIGGTTIASYPDDGRVNPNIMSGVTLSYPTPIVMHPEDICHFKQNDFTEYPFGFSDVKSCIDPATARLDINILNPILFKKYTKPMIHWTLNTEGVAPKNVGFKMKEMLDTIENMEPGSDPVTTDKWSAKPIVVNTQNGAIGELTGDVDTQIFAATGVPEKYFKSGNIGDKNILEADKTFIARMKIVQDIVAEQIEDKLIKPRIYKEVAQKKAMQRLVNDANVVENILEAYDSWLVSDPKYPELQWRSIFAKDDTQKIANAIALLNADIIDKDRAATMVGEKPLTRQKNEDANKIGIDDPLDNTLKFDKEVVREEAQELSPDINIQNTMQSLRGQANMDHAGENRRNEEDVKDPSQLGGSRYAQHKTKGDKGDLSQKHTGLK